MLEMLRGLISMPFPCIAVKNGGKVEQRFSGKANRGTACAANENLALFLALRNRKWAVINRDYVIRGIAENFWK